MENNQLGSSLENSFVDQIVADIRKENALGDHDSRRHRREKIVLPTFLYDLDGTEATGFTRDLSAAGVSIISNRQFQPQETWKIDLYRLDGSSNAFFSECRWSKPFGKSFWVSGWKFLCFER